LIVQAERARRGLSDAKNLINKNAELARTFD
jgi:hypothetical protein